MPFWPFQKRKTDLVAYRLNAVSGEACSVDPCSLVQYNNFLQPTYCVPGLYRILCPDDGWSRQFLTPESDPLNSLLLLMPCFCRGNRDDRLSFKRALKQLHRRKISMTCGPVSRFVQGLAEKFFPELRTRIVHTLTLQKHNSYNNGHTLLEVWNPIDKKWTLLDFNKGCVYVDKQGNRLSAYERVKLGGDRYDFFNPIRIDVRFFDFFEEWMSCPSGIEEYENRLFDALLIESNGNLTTDCQDPVIGRLYPKCLIMQSDAFKEFALGGVWK